MYAKRGSIEESQNIFSESPQTSQVSWAAILSFYARHGDFEPVMGLFEEMQRKAVPLDSITFLSVLISCGRRGMVDMGCRVFDSMIKDHHIEPSLEHYSCVLDMLGRAWQLDEAGEFVRQMSTKPGLSALQNLLGVCRIYGNAEMGKRATEALMQTEPTLSSSYVMISNIYAEKGDDFFSGGGNGFWIPRRQWLLLPTTTMISSQAATMVFSQVAAMVSSPHGSNGFFSSGGNGFFLGGGNGFFYS
ncbi:PREDICTED: pentatricopeptide repeat-containing protein At4g32430, mitochondrial-like [Nelumbo nucifera]|nr:PREDICTED: pentatricopeptide repeat-containing protein At4g32430, mitochondrial-like [Nelumbo nucifera]